MSDSPRTSRLSGPSLSAFPLTTCKHWKFPERGGFFFPLRPPLVCSNFTRLPRGSWNEDADWGLSVSCSRASSHCKSPPYVDKHPWAVFVTGSLEMIRSTHLKWNVVPSPFQTNSNTFLWLVSHPSGGLAKSLSTGLGPPCPWVTSPPAWQFRLPLSSADLSAVLGRCWSVAGAPSFLLHQTMSHNIFLKLI